MINHVTITQSEMGEVLKAEKGWVRNTSGYEYVYDYCIPNTPIIIKVLSSITVDNATGRNKGSDCIRVFAITKKNGKVKGLVKACCVLRVEGWRSNLQTEVIQVIRSAKERCNRYRK